MQTSHIRANRTSTAAVPRLLMASLLTLLFCGLGVGAGSASKPAQASFALMAVDFGTPPSGEVPIIYNDHHVYSKPDELKQSRVLAALVKDGTIFVPLRSMFEEMGATVSWDAASMTATVQKPGSSIQVTVGKNEVAINGETRPLDVPPEMYRGVVVVPVRVLSEAMGAYVLWLPDRHICVVRYIPPTVIPTAPPTQAPTAPPTPSPTPSPAPAASTYNGFIEAAGASSKTYNEFAAGQTCCRSYVASGGYVFQNSPIAIKVDYRQDEYLTSDNLIDPLGNHYTSFSTIDGGTALVPVFRARQNTLDGRLEYQIAAPRIYIGVGYIQASNNYGYPRLSGVGVGLEKLPDLTDGLNWFGSAYYYPTASGNYTNSNPASSTFGTTFRQQYQIVKYDLGLALVLARFPVYVYGGFSGDRYVAKQNAPINQTHSGPYIGLGVRF